MQKPAMLRWQSRQFPTQCWDAGGPLLPATPFTSQGFLFDAYLGGFAGGDAQSKNPEVGSYGVSRISEQH
jgi:hypothetical protein